MTWLKTWFLELQGGFTIESKDERTKIQRRELTCTGLHRRFPSYLAFWAMHTFIAWLRSQALSVSITWLRTREAIPCRTEKQACCAHWSCHILASFSVHWEVTEIRWSMLAKLLVWTHSEFYSQTRNCVEISIQEVDGSRTNLNYGIWACWKSGAGRVQEKRRIRKLILTFPPCPPFFPEAGHGPLIWWFPSFYQLTPWVGEFGAEESV